jgi:glycosyltransferase 2 family protein
MRRPLRLGLTLAVTSLAVAYLVWKIDLSQTWQIISHASFGWLLLSFVIMGGTVWPMAWRWRLLLAARAIYDRLRWLVRAYFVSYTAGQVLPTSIGGDAMRIFECSRRHPGNTGVVAGTVLLERALGGAATVVLAALGFVLAVGHYDVNAYIWIEAAFVLGTVVLGVLLFSRRVRGPVSRFVPLLRRLRVERPLRSVYEAIHAYRTRPWLLVGLFALTVTVQAVRVLAIWSTGKAVGVTLSPRPYYVMGPLLFLVLLIPFTINGLAVRESFFVSFLGGLGVDPSRAFATGFLFFVVTLTLSIPGALILGWENLRRSSKGEAAAAPGAPHPTTRTRF